MRTKEIPEGTPLRDLNAATNPATSASVTDPSRATASDAGNVNGAIAEAEVPAAASAGTMSPEPTEQ